MTWRFPLLWRTAAGLVLPLSVCVAAGCAATARQQAASAPSSQGVQQSGQANAAVQTSLDAPGWKAIEYHTDLPWKSVVLLVSYVAVEAVKQSIIVYLSHRREMQRLSTGRNGNGSLHIHS